MEEIPEEPRKELAISAAGPLSNLVIMAIMIAFLPLVTDWGSLSVSASSPRLIFERSFTGAYLYILVTNGILAVFNLLPAFPMDGGRVFRAFLALRMNRAKATRIAVVVGQELSLSPWRSMGSCARPSVRGAAARPKAPRQPRRLDIRP